MWLFLVGLWLGLQFVIVVFADHALTFLEYYMINDTNSEIRPWKFIRPLISLYIEMSFYRSPVLIQTTNKTM